MAASIPTSVMNRRRDRTSLWTGILAGACLLTLAACGPAAGPRWNDQPRGAMSAWVTVQAAADGHLAPVVDVTVPQRALVFARHDDGSYQARLEVSVTAMRGDAQAGGGVGQATARALSVADARREAPVRVRVPLQLRGDQPVSLIVEAAQRGTARRWRQVLAFSPATLAAAPLVIERAELRHQDPELIARDDTLLIVATCLRLAEAGDWPADGVVVELAVAGPEGDDAGTRTSLVQSPPDPGDAMELPLTWPARDLPFGRLQARLALAWRHDGDALRLPHDPTLEVVNLTVAVDRDASWHRHLDWLEGLIDGEWRGRLRDLPAAARGAAWDELWAELGRQQQASAAAARRQHLRRIVAADDRFGGDRRGALTDRGRVHVRWGEPAEVAQAADPLVPGAVWEFWTYPAAGLRFVFHDAHGLGDFRLRRTETL